MSYSAFCKCKLPSVGLNQGEGRGDRVLASLFNQLLILSNVIVFSNQADMLFFFISIGLTSSKLKWEKAILFTDLLICHYI